MTIESISYKTYLSGRQPATTPAGDDVLPILQGGTDVKKIKWKDLLIAAANYCEDTGNVNELVAVCASNFTTYIEALPYIIKVAHDNTGACTLALNGLAPKLMKKNGSKDLDKGDLLSGQIIIVVDDGENYQVISHISSTQDWHYAVSTGGNNAYVLTPSPVLDAYIPGMPIYFKANFTNTNAATINISGLGAIALKKNVSDALEADDIVINKIYIGMYDGINMQILNPSLKNQVGIVGAFRNLKASATGLDANIALSIDEIIVEDDNNNYAALRNISLTINSAATGANGLDTGTLAASTWYSKWVIYNPTTKTKAGLISLSSTDPMQPNGYTFKARTGWIRTDLSNKYPLSFIQHGRKVQFKVAAASNVTGLPTMASGGIGSVFTPTWQAIGISNFVPPTASKIMLVAYSTYGHMLIAPNNSYGPLLDATKPAPIHLSGGEAGSLYETYPAEMSLESTYIYIAAETSGGLCLVKCFGWEDNL